MTWFRVLKAVAEVPALVGSAAVLLFVAALLPPPAAAVVLVGGPAALLLLSIRRFEPVAVRLLYRGRAPRPAETAALAPVLVRLCAHGLGLGLGLGPPVITVYVRDASHEPSAEGVGRRSLLIDLELVQALQCGQVGAEEAAAPTAHAIGRVHHGGTRSDLVIQAITVPWRPVYAAGRTVAQAVAKLPLTRLAWRMRFVVAAVAVGQAAVDGRTATATVIAIVVSLTYLSPRAQHAWDQLMVDQGDQFARDHGFGPHLAAYVRRLPATDITLTQIRPLGPATPGPHSMDAATRRPPVTGALGSCAVGRPPSA